MTSLSSAGARRSQYSLSERTLYLPAASVTLLVHRSPDGQYLVIYSNEEFYKKSLLPVTVAWGWFMSFINLMTGGDHI